MEAEVVDIKNSSGTQIIEIPEQFKINDDKVFLKRNGNVISIIPYHNAWQNLYDSLNEFTDDFMQHRNEPAQQNREKFD